MQDLKRENLRLREVQGKDYWSFKGQDNKDSSTKIGVSGKNGTPYCIPSRDSSHNGNGISFEDLYMNTTTWGDKSKTKTEVWNLLKFGSEAIAPIHPITAGIASRSSDMIEALVKRREVAMSQSIFSAFLSFSVGMIIWKAEDPCMPLIVALFTVVGMSLKSVVQFFSTIKNKPASDAVALLSFNWFLLGTLTYPTLPVIAHTLFPLGSRFWDQLIK